MKNRFRSLEMGDLNGAVDLLNRSLVFDPMTPGLLKEKLWEDRDYDPELTLVVSSAGVLIALVAAVVRSEEMGYIKLIAVDPLHRGRGIGAKLLAELESRLTRQTRWVRLGESAPNYLWPGLDPRYTDASVFFEKRGYCRFSETRNLSVGLGSLPKRPTPPAAVSVKRASRGDREACLNFLSEHWPAWRQEVATAFDHDPVSLHLAFVADQLAAFSAYDCNNRGTGWFGPMGTDPTYRRLGLGRILLMYCLADIRDQGLERATIPWVGPIAFYNRAVGAAVDRVFIRYEKRLDPSS